MDGESPEFSVDTTRRANKEHKCCECGRKISLGEKYCNTKGVWEGEFLTFKTCEHCVIARDWIQDECGSFVYTALEEDLREHSQYTYDTIDPKLQRYITMIERKWKLPGGQLISIERLNTYRNVEVKV